MKAFRRTSGISATILAATVLVGGNDAVAQTATAVAPSITTPDKVESRIGRKKLEALADVLTEIEALHPSTSDVLAALPTSGAGHVRH